MALNSTKEVARAAGAYVRAQTQAAGAQRDGLFSDMLTKAASNMKAQKTPDEVLIESLAEDEADEAAAQGIAAAYEASTGAAYTSTAKAAAQSATQAATYTSGPIFSKGSASGLEWGMVATSTGDVLYNSLLPSTSSASETRYPSAVRIIVGSDGSFTVIDLDDPANQTPREAEQHYGSAAQIVVSSDGSRSVTYFDDDGNALGDGISALTSNTDTGATKSASKGGYATSAQILASGGTPITDSDDTSGYATAAQILASGGTPTTGDENSSASQALNNAAAAVNTSSTQTTQQTETSASNSLLSSLFGSSMDAESMQTMLMMALMNSMMGSGGLMGSSSSSGYGNDSGLMSANPAASAMSAAMASLTKAYQSTSNTGADSTLRGATLGASMQNTGLYGAGVSPSMTSAAAHSYDYSYMDDDYIDGAPVGNSVSPGTTFSAPLQSSENSRNPLLYRKVIEQFDVTDNRRYANNKKGTGDTYCNIFLWDVTRAMGAEIPHHTDWETGQPLDTGGKSMNANRISDWLNTYGRQYGWYEVSAEQAQKLANQGMPAVTVWKNENGKHGHVQVVSPSKDGSYNPARGVAIAQAGRKLTDYAYTTDIYGAALQEVQYFAHR